MKLRRTLTVPLVALALLLTGVSSATAADPLLSRDKPATASSVEGSSFAAAKAVDGSTGTRWASAEGHDPEWLRVDLGATAAISRVKIAWEAAYAKAYKIQVSADGTTWTQLYATTTGDGGIDDRTGLTGSGRYVRVYGTARATSYGYSILELEVYGSLGAPDTQAPTVPAAPHATGTTSSSVSLAWTASTDDVGVTGYEVLVGGAVVGTAPGTSVTVDGLTAATAYTFTVRALDGAGNRSASSAPVTATTAPAGSSFVVAAAGDIAEQCTASTSSCVHPKTAKLVTAMNPQFVITMGDNQYDDARLSDFQNYYDKSWGPFKAKTRPVPGNHETYDPAGSLAGYKSYFGAIAYPQGKSYYSYDAGNWHFLALDSNSFDNAAQLAWLKSDLAANTKGCIAAYWHHPLFTSGEHGNDPVSKPVWNELYAAHADLILNGHDHTYERFAPQTPGAVASAAGMVEIVGGMGGASPYNIVNVQPNSLVRLSGKFGVLKLTFTDTSFGSQLIGTDGAVLDSSPTYTCH